MTIMKIFPMMNKMIIYLYMRCTIRYILKPLSTIILFYLTYYSFILIFNYLFISEPLPCYIIKEEENIFNDIKKLQLYKINNNIIPLYNKEYFRQFYDLLHPDYYETYIKLLLV